MAVVDAGFFGLASSIAMGELPENTTAVDFTGFGIENSTPHGVVVAEHLMDMAPGIDLTVIMVGDEVDVENAADYIRDHDIQVLNLSLGWFGRSYYDDTGPITPIFNELHDVDGVFCAVAAGNDARGHWRGGWIDEDGDGVLEFAPGVEQITVIDPRGILMVLNWNQYGNSETDLAADLIATPIDGGEERVVKTSDFEQNGPQDPVEALGGSTDANDIYSIRIRWVGGNLPPDLDMTLQVLTARGLDYGFAASSVVDPAVGHGVFTVGAIDQLNWTLPDPPLEVFSSQGPTNDGRLKPNLVAPDGTSSWNDMFGDKAFGTSFSSPTTAGAAALLIAQDPSRTALDVADVLHAGAVDKGAPGPDPEYGYGLLRLAVGEPPVATDDVGETEEDTAVNIAVLANDSDPDGHALTVAEVDDPLHGTAQIDGDQITYTPDADFNGEDVFVYHVADTFEYDTPATVVVTVNPVQDAPRPVDDVALTTPGMPVTLDVLNNDQEPDGEPLTISHVGAGGDGVAVSNGDGTVTYTPNPGFDGVDTFEYTVADPHGATGSATVEVWVSNQNTAPVAFDDYGETAEDTAAVVLQAFESSCRDDADCDDGNLCTLDVCNIETGQCESSPQAVPCDDEIACTVEDMCQGDGSCAGTLDHGLCDDADVCTDDVCEFGLGCENPHNAAPCDDGVACTAGDVCAGGECQGLASCPAGEICDVESGQCIFEPECVIDADCDDGNNCTDNVCDVQSGLCVASVNQSPCDDGVGCTDGDTCHDGACQGGAANHDTCDDGNVCTDDLCDTDTGCAHNHNVDPCDDGAGCTDNDTCVEGLCAGHDTCPEALLCDLEIGVCRPRTQPVLFRAYNDLAWREGQILHNITHITTPGSFLPAIGELVDYASGAPTGVMLAVAGGRYDPNMHGRDGRPAPAGTDAGDLFGGIVDTLGALTYVADYGSPLILTFSGLDPEGNYAVAFHGDRGSYGWDRASRVTLVRAETFTNESSAAQDNPAPDSGGALFSGADDASTRLPANNPNGYVARFVEIRPDDNGEIVLLIEPDGNAGARGKYASAVMIEQRSTGCHADADCDDANACTDDACNVVTATCAHTPNQAVCDDGIACTGADQCIDGVCVGGAPEDALCDDDNVCTADACEIGLGCVYQNTAGPCDDNSACTDNDTCAEGVCAGADTCPAGQSCDVESDQCVDDGGEAQPVFRAFNDLAWGGGQLKSSITRITSPAGGWFMPSTGELLDYATGVGTGVTLTVTGGIYNGGGHARDGRDAPDDTDAGGLFSGIVSTQGAIAYVNRPNSPLILTFTGLDPTLTYTVALHGDRGAYGWDRASLATLGGVDAFINASSEAADNPDPASGGALFAGPDDPSTRLPADNPRGYVARFSGISAGNDGEITLTLTANGNAGYRGKYASAVMLEAAGSGCADDAECEDQNPCTDGACAAGRCVSMPNTNPCDDGLACTVEDTCADAQCIGVEACPEGSLCDPESGECVAGAAWDWMAYNDLYFSGTSNAPNTTRHDYRVDQAPLLDFNTGAPLPVTMTGTTVGGYDPTLSGGDLGQATDADAVFGGIVSLHGSFELDAPNWQNVVTFDGLDPTKHYTVALTANRNSGRYQSARYTRVSIAGADAFVHEGTLGIDINSPDSVSLSTGYNDRGLVARWTHITAADGSFSIVSEWDNTRGSGGANSKGYAMSVFQLIQSAAP